GACQRSADVSLTLAGSRSRDGARQRNRSAVEAEKPEARSRFQRVWKDGGSDHPESRGALWAWWLVRVAATVSTRARRRGAMMLEIGMTKERVGRAGSIERSPAFWHPHRGARVSLVANRDGSFSPRTVKVTLHKAGMLVERQIAVPPAVRLQSFVSRDAAAAAALD